MGHPRLVALLDPYFKQIQGAPSLREQGWETTTAGKRSGEICGFPYLAQTARQIWAPRGFVALFAKFISDGRRGHRHRLAEANNEVVQELSSAAGAAEPSNAD
jgi:hypothetical protein